ncbi:MAG: serine/threonine protein phosphatase [Desulfobacterales bacterium]|nr:serine/threonine protein phosphatase [Desulfobacterales bacterium]
MERYFAIGDVHGCFDKLKLLLEKVEIDFERDRLIFLGDYIDRGDSSFNVIEFLIDLKRKYSNIVFLKGNHELMLENYLLGTDKMTYISNGGIHTIESYAPVSFPDTEFSLPVEHYNFFKSLVPYFETKDYLFVHAGLRENVSLENQTLDDLLWIRKGFIQSEFNFGRRIIFGHTPFMQPFVMSNKIGIDTGAVYGNKLTCIELPALKFYSI